MSEEASKESISEQTQAETENKANETRKYERKRRLPDRFKPLVPKGPEPLVCIKRKAVYIPKQLAELYNIQNARFAVIGYDPELSEIGIIFYEKDPLNDGIHSIPITDFSNAVPGEFHYADRNTFAFCIDFAQVIEEYNLKITRSSVFYRLHGDNKTFFTISLDKPVKKIKMRGKKEAALHLFQKKEMILKAIATLTGQKEELIKEQKTLANSPESERHTEQLNNIGVLLDSIRQRIHKQQKRLVYFKKEEARLEKLRTTEDEPEV
jgi:hypothetical protein